VAWLLIALLAMSAAGSVRAQEAPQSYARSDPEEYNPYMPLNPDLANGGLFIAGEYVMYRQSNPLRSQVIAFRGFVSTSAETGVLPGVPRGTGETALDVNQLTGTEYSAGYKYEIGYRFQDGGVLSFSDTRLFNANKGAGATFANHGFVVGNHFEDSFLTAPVFNFPAEFSGPTKLNGINGMPAVGGAIGIWNGAQEMTEKFTQRTEWWDLKYRQAPYYETEICRLSGWYGARYFKIRDEFTWQTIDIDITTGSGGGQNTGVYTQISSNNLYGPFIGQTWEQYIGKGLAIQLDLGAALMIDIVRERAKYASGLKDVGLPQGKTSRTDYTVAPELDGSLALMWYPWQGVQFRFGYNYMAVFNTVGSQNPVGFNFPNPDPKYNRLFLRNFDGFDAGVAFIW
jgi:hypothetical protein